MSIRPYLERYPPEKDRSASHGLVFRLADVVREGKVILPGEPDPLISRRLIWKDGDKWSPADLEMPLVIYAVKNGEMRIGIDGGRKDPKAVKHDSLFDGASRVDAAGEITFRDGKITDVNDKSGTYGCFQNGLRQ